MRSWHLPVQHLTVRTRLIFSLYSQPLQLSQDDNTIQIQCEQWGKRTAFRVGMVCKVSQGDCYLEIFAEQLGKRLAKRWIGMWAPEMLGDHLCHHLDVVCLWTKIQKRQPQQSCGETWLGLLGDWIQLRLKLDVFFFPSKQYAFDFCQLQIKES